MLPSCTLKKIACGLLGFRYPDRTFSPGSDGYTYESLAQYWSARTYNTPAYVLVPQDAKQVSFAVTTLTLSLTQLAARSGGLRWRDVYSYLSGSGLVTVGGRLGGVAVSGLLLAGGISFDSNRYGFTAENVGGGNSFAVVTHFDLKTVKSPKVWVSISQYAQPDSAKYLDAVYDFGKYGSADGKAAITFQPITKGFIQQGIAQGGSPQGVGPAKAIRTNENTGHEISDSKHGPIYCK
ncbi:hypothetical protein LX36DRAFT_749448 [Colletotrichum falcatum]|nr:hypothetical protein LX36DRAFT_749448 [Colletotrichum falcatum]